MLKKLRGILNVVLVFIALPLFAASEVASLPHQSHDPVAGNPKGDITVVEFFDYQCYHCTRMAPVIATIIKQNPNVRIVFKEYPLQGELSEYAARAALAAHLQNKYYAFNHALLTSRDELTQSNILLVAKQQGLDVNAPEKVMFSKPITQQLRANYNLAQSLQITGTPAFLVGKTNAMNISDIKLTLGEMTVEELQTEINRAKR